MDRVDKEKLAKDRQVFEKKVLEVVNATGKLLAPLKNLNEAQLDAVTVLCMFVRTAMLFKLPALRLGDSIFEGFSREFASVYNPIRDHLAEFKMACIEHQIAYATAMTTCRKEGIKEEDCWEADSAHAAAMYCALEQMELMKEAIRDILKTHSPPLPDPWPDM